MFLVKHFACSVRPEAHLNTSTDISIKVIGLAQNGSSGVQIVTFGVLNLFCNQILCARCATMQFGRWYAQYCSYSHI